MSAKQQNLFAKDPMYEDPRYIKAVSRLKKQPDGTYTFTDLTYDEVSSLYIAFMDSPHRKHGFDPLHLALQRACADHLGEILKKLP